MGLGCFDDRAHRIGGQDTIFDIPRRLAPSSLIRELQRRNASPESLDRFHSRAQAATLQSANDVNSLRPEPIMLKAPAANASAFEVSSVPLSERHGIGCFGPGT